ncbi:hypothetical protein GGS23DRAFT_614018, partial [Durotheca rogersii]|uniref:uncharacterized protein n=1 Tax=Durotheca rogersii TaxID=419775 RepID=UPI00221E9582
MCCAPTSSLRMGAVAVAAADLPWGLAGRERKPVPRPVVLGTQTSVMPGAFLFLSVPPIFSTRLRLPTYPPSYAPRTRRLARQVGWTAIYLHLRDSRTYLTVSTGPPCVVTSRLRQLVGEEVGELEGLGGEGGGVDAGGGVVALAPGLLGRGLVRVADGADGVDPGEARGLAPALHAVDHARRVVRAGGQAEPRPRAPPLVPELQVRRPARRLPAPRVPEPVDLAHGARDGERGGAKERAY